MVNKVGNCKDRGFLATNSYQTIPPTIVNTEILSVAKLHLTNRNQHMKLIMQTYSIHPIDLGLLQMSRDARKTCLQGFRPGSIETGLNSHLTMLKA